MSSNSTARHTNNENKSEEGGDHSTTSSSCCWSLSIKPVGAEHASSSAASPTPSSSTSSTLNAALSKDFVIQVSPDDDLASLYDRIERVTGLKASQQRLIYRGQLIGGNSSSNPYHHRRSSSPQPTPQNGDEDDNGVGSNGERKGEASSDLQQQDGGSERTPGTSLKIKDIRGLSSGHTIHLVRKREPPSATEESSSSSSESPPRTPRTTASGGGSETEVRGNASGGGVTAPLLAALLGLTSDATTSPRGGSEAAAAVVGTASSTPRLRATPSSSSSRARASTTPSGSTSRAGTSGGYGGRRAHYRLTAEDLESVPDPGSLESVRQGMMTLHTMLPHAARREGPSWAGSCSPQPTSSTAIASPQHHQHRRRRWFVGQWIDCLDTVNQWLEATILEIVTPEDVLPPVAPLVSAANSTDAPTSSSLLQRREEGGGRGSAGSIADPVVTASDLRGRRLLLLEPCDPRDSPFDPSGELAGFRRRDGDDNDHHIQLLLVHYNGWPHRWDEWIRSDSHRIRPFRARTRHPSASSLMSPTPQSAYADSPSTRICPGPRPNLASRQGDEETEDRIALLPELRRVMNAVNDLVGAASDGVASHSPSNHHQYRLEGDSAAASNLPWMSASPQSEASDPSNLDSWTSLDTLSPSAAGVDGPATSSPGPALSSPPRSHQQLRGELAALAPLLDRLGRTLIDAAPHVAALSRSLNNDDAAGAAHPPSAPAGAASAANDEAAQQSHEEEHPTSLGGLLSLLGRDRRRQSNASHNVVVPGDTLSQDSAQTVGGASDDGSSVDPDLSDLVFGAVNTTRGEVRRGPRSRPVVADDAASLLGTYLAAASLSSLLGGSGDNDEDDDAGLQSLGRILRDRGSGGGIDIHIHAVVTAPGGALPAGLAAMGGGVGAASGGEIDGGSIIFSSRSPSRVSPNRSNSARPLPSALQEDDEGIFSALYSENPAPVDPSRPQYLEESAPPLEESSVDRPRSVSRSISSSSRTISPRNSDGTDRNSARHRRSGGNRSSSSSISSRRTGNLFSRFLRRSNTGNE